MSEQTYPGDTSPGGDWSQVYTDLDWVARWMADRGYTDAEIGYVVDQPAIPAAAAEGAVAPVWRIRLDVVEQDAASTEDPEPSESVPA